MSLEFEQMAETYGLQKIMADNGRYTLTDRKGDLWVTVLASENAATNNKRLFAARKFIDQQYAE